MESLATKATMSAQETMEGHSASNKLFTLSMKSNPLSVRFGFAVFSVALPDSAVKFKRTDASQPYNNNHKAYSKCD